MPRKDEAMIYKRGSKYWVKFQHAGRMIYKPTGQTSQTKARQVEARLRSELTMGNFGILQRRQGTTLEDFLKDEFLPFVGAHFADQVHTKIYYQNGAKMLAADFGNVVLAEITSQHAAGFASRHDSLAVSTINRSLRTLRRALNLAVEWDKLGHAPKVQLLRGERQRDQIVSDNDFARYIAACPQPWHDVVMVMRGTGMRPNEVYTLRWEHVLLNGTGGLIQVARGKTKAARRALPMVPEVYAVLRQRYEIACQPENGWVFPAPTASGHVEQSGMRYQHLKTLKESGVTPFEPYCLRHTALTRLAESGCDSFTLAKIAGHSSITMTQRYCHPQAEAIQSAFRKLTGDKSGDSHSKKLLNAQ
jgi:integrase